MNGVVTSGKEERVPETGAGMVGTVGGTTLNATASPGYHPYFFRSSLPPPIPPKDRIDASLSLLALDDKPLPPPPSPEAMITGRQTRDEHGQISYMDWSSGSEEDDSEANTDYLRDQSTASHNASPISPVGSRAPSLPPATPSEHISVRSRTVSAVDTQDHPQPFIMNLPDPNLFPEPYPFRHHHQHHHHHHLASPPALSSAGSSSTRSSAYTSSGSAVISGDYNHVHVASGDDERNPSLGLNSDSFVLHSKDDAGPPRLRTSTHKTAPHDQGRWSESYTSSRSRSSSIGGNSSSHGHDTTSPSKLKERPSYETDWVVDEKDEVGLSDDETDDDQPLIDHDNASLDDIDEERTSAAVIADEGRGLIIQAAETPVVQLQVQPGTTHLLIGSSTTPNAVPAFLTNSLPQICHNLLALDISANFLGALPPVLAVCVNLEELNVASNPLRVLPVFLVELRNLRVLIADSTGISTLPDALVELDKLHTISIRRNKLHALPSWLCMLPALQTLCVDNNPFQGPWNALVEPLLAKIPMTPMYPPSTPVFPLPSASIQSSICDGENDGTDTEDLSDNESRPSQQKASFPSPEDEDQTITPDRAPHLGRSFTAPSVGEITGGVGSNVPPTLSRTRTTPNRTYFEQSRARPGTSSGSSRGTNPPSIDRQPSDVNLISGDRELRKMKSAGELPRGKSTTTNLRDDKQISLPNSKVLSVPQPTVELPIPTHSPPSLPISKRYGSLGPASSLGPAPRTNNTNTMRQQLSKSLWDTPSEPMADSPVSQNRVSLASSPTTVSRIPSQASKSPARVKDEKSSHRPRLSKDGKEKGGRWGFLKKMSMSRMKVEHPPPLPTHNLRGIPAIPERFSKTPQIDLRLSTTGSLDAIIPPSTPPQTYKQPSSDLLRGSPSVDSTATLVSTNTMVSTGAAPNSLLVPPTQTSRTGKRRSFLPIDGPGGLSINLNFGTGINGGENGTMQKLNIPIPDNSTFVSGLTASGDFDEGEARVLTPSPTVDAEQLQRREEERSKEAYMRALRSVMAYLKDMNDLNMSQQANPLSMYGHIQAPGRPPTIVDAHVQGHGYNHTQLQREASIGSSGTTTPSSVSSAATEGPNQLRPMETVQRLRSGTTSRTVSIATTDSASSSEERKYKDDKSKRAMIIKEIVLTERTYVKGLQGLVDIYIKPGTVPLNILSGSSKETVVPMSERKVVFGGIESLFSFHNESFLPALEAAAAPIMVSPEKLSEADADGQLSMKVAKAVGEIFVKHAAFMKMYSSYINNFDNSVQRVKYWSSDKHTAGATPSTTVSPTSSTVQLASLALSTSVIPIPVPDGTSSGLPNLSTSQRRRLKTYLKRCRMNPKHTQLNLEGYLLLPVQRIPRYRLLLEELLRNTPPLYEYMEDPLDRALAEISLLANNMNEGKRDAESRQKLVQWQLRIRGKFPSPLVQPHRRLIMDGPLLLTRVVRKAVVSFDTINSHGDPTTVQVDCLAPELTPRPLVGILCNDLLVLCRDPSNGQDLNSYVDLWAVLRMQTLPQPASITHGNSLRLVDNKAILYFDAPTPSDALNWYRAINLHIPASKT